ncbi:TonB-dependent receptor [Parasphingopyxis sp.]|uniref:TonB-dependent receptor n=1 Tax=Parasphingopyxis sp. TaxID=1920299 RepID=UPI003F9FAE3E
MNAQAPDDSIVAEPIIVTANKRDQAELDVPTSLEVLSGETLTAARITRVEELAALTPNVDVAEFSDGQYRLIYRGVGATGTSDNQNFNTAIDSVIVPYGRAYRLLDIERVEVLRGPQGTLYGRNTKAGVINIVTNDGRTGAPARLVVSYGSRDTASLSAAAGGRIDNSDLFFRAAGRYERTDGFVTNPVLGRTDSHRNRNGTARATFGWEGGDWLVRAAITYDEYQGFSDDLTPIDTPRQSPAPDLGESDGRLILPVLTIERTGPITVSATTAFASTRRNLTVSAVISPVLIGQFDEYDSFSQELRLTGETMLWNGPFEWIAGAYYLRERNVFRSTITFTPADFLLLDQWQERTTRAGALFGELVYDVADRWRITAGLRLAVENQDVDYRAAPTLPEENSEETYWTLQPKLALAYLLGGDGQIYATVTRGFRAGSVFIGNAPTRDVSYDPENTWQYELGYKRQFANGRFQLETAAFYIDWTDLQVQRSVITSTDPFTIGTIVDNAARARSWGSEASFEWRPANAANLFVRSGFTNARYRDYEPQPGLSFSDNRIESVPEYTLSVGGSWRPVEGLGAGVDLTHVGPMPYDAANSSIQSSYTLLNAQISYDFGPVRVALVGRNLFDEDYATRGIVAAGSTLAHFARPLTVTGEVNVRF